MRQKGAASLFAPYVRTLPTRLTLPVMLGEEPRAHTVHALATAACALFSTEARALCGLQVKGGEDRVEEIIASKMRDMGLSETSATLKIPEHCVVNSRAHLRKYAGAEKSEDYDGTFIRNPPAPSEFKKVATLPVDETWSALLLSGVAAHMPHDNSLNPAGDTSYTNYVADQMENGKLAVCGVTKDFTYGANVPCTSVLVDKDFLTKHSANTLRQFIGRVARTGLAPFGVAQFEDDDFLPKMCGKNDNQEAMCMEATAKHIIQLIDSGAHQLGDVLSA